jgi:hypothetical protein
VHDGEDSETYGFSPTNKNVELPAHPRHPPCYGFGKINGNTISVV